MLKKISLVLLLVIAAGLLSKDQYSSWNKYVGKSPSAPPEEMIELCDALSQEKTYANKSSLRFLVAGKDGWIFRTDMDLKDDLELSDWSRESFARLKKAFEYNGSALAITMIPTRGLVGHENLVPPYSEKYDFQKAKDGYREILDSFEAAGIITANLRHVDQKDDFFLKRDNHWTNEGAQYAAQKMAEAIKEQPFYKGLKKQKFVTAPLSSYENKDANDRFLQFVKDKCGEKPPLEILPQVYDTSPIQNEDELENALLGEKEQAEVALVGTSNSTRISPSFANFAGYLMEYLSVDIANYAIPGGSFRGSIGNYILGGDYFKAKPRLVIWELSAHYGLDQKETFREIIPALYGACSNADALVSAKGALKDRKNNIFKDLKDMNLFSSRYYLHLDFENKDIREFKVIFQYHKEDDDVFDVERAKKDFPSHNGQFFVELNAYKNEPLKSIELNIKKGGAGSYTAKICQVPDRS